MATIEELINYKYNFKYIEPYGYKYHAYPNGNIWNTEHREFANILYTDRYNKNKGYCVGLFNHKLRQKASHPLHRLLAELYVPNPQNKPIVSHIDTNKRNNHIENLIWTTRSENLKIIKNFIGPKEKEHSEPAPFYGPRIKPVLRDPTTINDNNTSGYNGVSINKSKQGKLSYQAVWRVNNKTKSKTFKTILEAVAHRKLMTE
jgi:hypothetical protein